MRIIVVAPEQGDECFDAEPKDLDQESLAEVLPFLPPPPLRSAHPARFQPRPVLGEILRGEDGTLYERFGNRIRPLRRLVSGPDGELLETAGGPEGSPRLRARVAADPSRGGNGLELERDAYVIETEREQACVPPPKRANAEVGGDSVHGGAKTSFHPLFPEPGQWRVVRLGDFKPMLVPQIAHPERLRDVHRLPCYVQVFEITAPQRIEAMAEAIFDDSEATSQLRPLTPAIVHQLQLAPLLPAPVSPIPPVPRQPGLFRPGDRVFCLEIANDPTDDAREKKCSSAVANEVRTGKSEIRNQKSEMGQSLPGSAATFQRRPGPATTECVPKTEPESPSPHTSGSEPRPSALKTSIPPQFLKPWEFRLSREEALFDMIRARSFVGRVRAALYRVVAGPLFNGELRKWQVFLTGKNLDEQLWTVRPPRRALDHPFIREWATQTLQLAGYDPALMLSEWEIYWRRKGTRLG